MASRITSPRRPGESVLTGGRTIRKARSRSSSQAPRTNRPSVPLIDFLDNVLKFSKALLRQDTSPLRDNLMLGLHENLDTAQEHTIDYATSEQADENWTASCAAIKMELNRLVMWKFDVFQRKLTPALKEDSPVYSIICESILGIGDILKSLASTQFIASSADTHLRLSYKTVENSLEYFRSQPNSTAASERPSSNTRSQKSAVEGFQEGNVLKTLRSDIDRLLHLVDTMAGIARTTTVTTL